MQSDIDPDVLEARRRKAEADADFEVKLAEAQYKVMRELIIRELERRDGRAAEDL